MRTRLTLAAQIRDAAGDALTGLISPAEVAATVLSLLDGVESCAENEVCRSLAGIPSALTKLAGQMHGRLVQALRLLEASAPLALDEQLPREFELFLSDA